MLSAALGRSAPVPNNTYCPSLCCHVDDFTSLAVCPLYDSEVIQFDKESKDCSYSVETGLDQWFERAGAPGKVAYLRTSENGPSFDKSRANQGRRGNLSSYAELISIANKTGKGSVLRRICSMKFDKHSAFHLLLRVFPKRWYSKSIFDEFKISNLDSTQILSRLPWFREIILGYSSTNEHLVTGKDYMEWQTGIPQGVSMRGYTQWEASPAPKKGCTKYDNVSNSFSVSLFSGHCAENRGRKSQHLQLDLHHYRLRPGNHPAA
jgi:hypothetical protein